MLVAAPVASAKKPTCVVAPDANCAGVDLSNEFLDNRDLTGIDFTGATLGLVRFSNLTGAKLDGAHMENSDFFGVNLTDASLRGAFLTDAVLQEANLTRADFTGAHAHAVGGSPYPADPTDPDDPTFGTDFSNTAFTDTIVDHADFSGVDLDGARINRASFVGSNLTGVNLYQSWIANSDFTGADLSGAKMSYGWIRGSNFTSTNLSRADMTQEGLRRVTFTHARWTGALCPNKRHGPYPCHSAPSTS